MLLRKKEKEEESNHAITLATTLYNPSSKYVVGVLELGDNSKSLLVAASHLLSLIGSGGVFLASLDKVSGKGLYIQIYIYIYIHIFTLMYTDIVMTKYNYLLLF